jgi:dienelactone hydrolase
VARTFFVDQGGSGEALRLYDLKVERESEAWVSLCVDRLQQEPDIDRDRIGIIAVSFGGYIAPRAAAFERRLKCCIAIGANPIGDKINPVDFEKDLSVHEITNIPCG